MGMYDHVECAASLPGAAAIAGKKFQTRSLYGVLGRLTISEEGRLIYHSVRYESEGGTGPLPFMKAIPTGDIDLDFHGDIKLTPEDDDVPEYVVRFTHGTLESVRLFADLTEAERMLTVRRNLED
jgi:hypothetical protein